MIQQVSVATTQHSQMDLSLQHTLNRQSEQMQDEVFDCLDVYQSQSEHLFEFSNNATNQSSKIINYESNFLSQFQNMNNVQNSNRPPKTTSIQGSVHKILKQDRKKYSYLNNEMMVELEKDMQKGTLKKHELMRKYGVSISTLNRYARKFNQKNSNQNKAKIPISGRPKRRRRVSHEKQTRQSENTQVTFSQNCFIYKQPDPFKTIFIDQACFSNGYNQLVFCIVALSYANIIHWKISAHAFETEQIVDFISQIAARFQSYSYRFNNHTETHNLENSLFERNILIQFKSLKLQERNKNAAFHFLLQFGRKIEKQIEMKNNFYEIYEHLNYMLKKEQNGGVLRPFFLRYPQVSLTIYEDYKL